ncbi:hypothetical protein YC2023_096483 [Brassica napus]
MKSQKVYHIHRGQVRFRPYLKYHEHTNIELWMRKTKNDPTEKKKAYHKMQPQQHSGDQDALKIALQNDSVVAMLMWYCEFVISIHVLRDELEFA